MATIHLMSGLPGSGKTYYLDNCIGEDAKTRILHRDNVRAQLREHYHSDKYFPVSKDVEYDAWIDACASVILAHPNAHHYYFDQTTLGNGSAAKFFDELTVALSAIGINIGQFTLQVDVMDTDYDICKERNAKRDGFERVPDMVLENMALAPGVNERLREYIPKCNKLIIHTIIDDTYKEC